MIRLIANRQHVVLASTGIITRRIVIGHDESGPSFAYSTADTQSDAWLPNHLCEMTWDETRCNLVKMEFQSLIITGSFESSLVLFNFRIPQFDDLTPDRKYSVLHTYRDKILTITTTTMVHFLFRRQLIGLFFCATVHNWIVTSITRLVNYEQSNWIE